MSIAPFSFREFGANDVAAKPSVATKSFLPHGRKKEEAPPPPPPPPTFSEAEIQEAERNSYQKGFLAGISEGKQQAESDQATTEKLLEEKVEIWMEQSRSSFSVYRDMIAHQAGLLPQLAHAIAKKVANIALDERAEQLIESVARQCVEVMMHEPNLQMTMHDSFASIMEEKIQTIATRLQYPGTIKVVGDPNISKANCRFEWRNGTMIRDTEQLWQQVESVIQSMITSGIREAEQICDAIEPPPQSPPLEPSTGE